MDGSLDNEALHNVRKLAECAKKNYTFREFTHISELHTEQIV